MTAAPLFRLSHAGSESAPFAENWNGLVPISSARLAAVAGAKSPRGATSPRNDSPYEMRRLRGLRGLLLGKDGEVEVNAVWCSTDRGHAVSHALRGGRALGKPPQSPQSPQQGVNVNGFSGLRCGAMSPQAVAGPRRSPQQITDTSPERYSRARRGRRRPAVPPAPIGRRELAGALAAGACDYSRTPGLERERGAVKRSSAPRAASRNGLGRGFGGAWISRSASMYGSRGLSPSRSLSRRRERNLRSRLNIGGSGSMLYDTRLPARRASAADGCRSRLQIVARPPHRIESNTFSVSFPTVQQTVPPIQMEICPCPKQLKH